MTAIRLKVHGDSKKFDRKSLIIFKRIIFLLDTDENTYLFRKVYYWENSEMNFKEISYIEVNE